VNRQTRTDLAHGAEAAATGLEAAQINPATPAGAAHYSAVLQPILNHILRGSTPPDGAAPTDDGDPEPQSAGGLTMAAIDKMSAEEIADRWDEVAAVIKAEREGAKS